MNGQGSQTSSKDDVELWHSNRFQSDPPTLPETYNYADDGAEIDEHVNDDGDGDDDHTEPKNQGSKYKLSLEFFLCSKVL